MDQDAKPPGHSATLDEYGKPARVPLTGPTPHAQPYACQTPLVDPEDQGSQEMARPTRYPYTHSFWQELLYANRMGPPLLDGDGGREDVGSRVESATDFDYSAGVKSASEDLDAAQDKFQDKFQDRLQGKHGGRAPSRHKVFELEPTVDEMAVVPVGAAGLPVRYVFRHCPTALNAQGIAQAWRETLVDEASLQQQLSPSLFARTAEVLTLDADGWPLHFCERRDISSQTIHGLTALLGWSGAQIASFAKSEHATASGSKKSLPPINSVLPCRLAIVSGPPAYSGILLVAQQCLCDSQTLHYILVRFWRRYQGLPKFLPHWSDCFPSAKETATCLNYWRDLLARSRWSALPRDVGDARASLPALNTTARFISEAQWRLIQQASAVLGVDVESVMLSAFSRWLMQVTQSDAALFGVLSVRSPTAPVSPPELKPFSVQAGGNLAAGQWVEAISEQLRLAREHAMPHLAHLAQALGQSPFSVSELLLETIFCFEYIHVDWPEALAPITSFGNTNGQLGTHGRLQLTIDITEERMRLVWWGAAHYISQAQLQAFEKSFDRTLMDLLHAVLQFNQWSCLDPRHKQPISMGEPSSLPDLPSVLAHDNLLLQLQYWVDAAPHACMIATERRVVTRLVMWIAAAIFVQETLQRHPQFGCDETHHPVIILADDPAAILLLVVAAQMSMLVPLVLSVDARRTLLADRHHPAWGHCAKEWLLTTRQVTEEADAHVVVVPVELEQLLSRAEQFVAMCQAQDVPITFWQTAPPDGLAPANHTASLPPVSMTLWAGLDAFFQSELMQRARAVPASAPVFGYFDPIASVQCQQRIVTHSGYWRAQAQYLMSVADQSPGRFFQVIQVGQALDHAGFWPCISALYAGAPLLWITPDLLLGTKPNGDSQGRSPLPECLLNFLSDEPVSVRGADSAAVLSGDTVARAAAQVASRLIDAPTEGGRLRGDNGLSVSRAAMPLCFLPELAYGVMASEARLQAVRNALNAQVRCLLIGEGRLRLPAEQGPLPPTLLSVCEREAVSAPVHHAGDTYTSAGRVLLGFVKPAPVMHAERRSQDVLVLGALLPESSAVAAGNQRGSLDYCRSTLRLDIAGVWPVEPPESDGTRSLLRAAAWPRRILRWELATTVILRGRLAPIIEIEDAQFAPLGAWSAACQFWERLVANALSVCWVKVRPESQTLGQASVRIVPFDAKGVPAQAQLAVMPFAQSETWARIHTPAGRHWGAGVTPRWDEIFGPRPHKSTAQPLAQSMTLARLTERILQLPETPSISQSWSDLGGDWFALFRLTFVLRRLGWNWTLPIRSLRQPLARLALQLARSGPRSPNQAETFDSACLPGIREAADWYERARHGLGDPQVEAGMLPRPRIVHSLDLSAYQLGVFRRYPQSLSQQAYRLQFYYSGTVRLAQLRAALNRWVSLFPALTSFFELTGKGMQQRILSEPIDDVADLGQKTAQSVYWADLLDHALDFHTVPFQSAYLEKLRLEDNCLQLQLSRPPMWRCVVYPKGQGRWSVWLMAHKLLFDTREWLDSIRCLELLLFEAMDVQQVLPWLDHQTPPWQSLGVNETVDRCMQNRLHTQSQSARVLPAHVQASVARFWQSRADLGCQPLVKAPAKARIAQDRLKTVIQPLPESLNGESWRVRVAGTGLDRLTLLLWAVSQGLMDYKNLTAFRMDLDVPWSAMGAQAPNILTGQSGPIPFFLQRVQASAALSLVDFKQQLYEQLMAPNPECLLVPGNLAFEQFYDALYTQDVCFSYLESLPENAELSSLADIEQLRRYQPCEFLEAHSPYCLKIEAFPSRDRFVLAWRFDESLIPSAAVEAFIEAVDKALAHRLGKLLMLSEAGLASGELAERNTIGVNNEKGLTDAWSAPKTEDEKVKEETERKRYWSPIDFGMSAWPESDWSRCLKRLPNLVEVWQPMAVNAWTFRYGLSNPLAQCRGSQATRCHAAPVSVFRQRLKTLSLLVPEISARWAVFTGGTVVLAKTKDLAAVVRQVASRSLWDAMPPPASYQDDQGLVLPCLFTLYYASATTVLVRCDYDLRAFEPGLISAVLATLAAGSLQPIKSALPKLWLANTGLGFPRATRLRLNAQYSANKQRFAQTIANTSSQPLLGVGRSDFAFHAYDQVRATYWQHCFAPLVGAPQLRAWLPMTERIEQAWGDGLGHAASQSERLGLRQTTVNVISDQQCTLRDQMSALVLALQTIRRYLLRLWGDQHWIVHVLFADRASLTQVGLAQHWAQHPHTSPHCWMPVFLGGSQVAQQDTEHLLAQLQRSAQYPLESESELCHWLGWSQSGLSDILLVVSDGDPKSAALQDWHRLQLAPLQFQWNPQQPSIMHMSAHSGLALTPLDTCVDATVCETAIETTGGRQTHERHVPLTLMAKQALHFPNVQQAQARLLDLTRVVGELPAQVGASGEKVRYIKILDICFAHLPELPGVVAHQVQNFLSARLNSALLPDLVRVCDATTWGETDCYQWLSKLHGSYQAQLKQRLTSLLFQSESAITPAALMGDYRSWFWPVGENLPGWQAERARASLQAVPEPVATNALSVRALRTLHHWAQWSDGGRRAQRQKGVPQSPVERRWELTPDQACWLAMGSETPGFFNAQMLLHFSHAQASDLFRVLQTLVVQEPIFRLQFCAADENQSSANVPTLHEYGLQKFSSLPDADLIAAAIERVRLSAKSVEQLLEGMTRVTHQWQSRFDLSKAPLVRLILFDCGQQRGPYLVILGSRLAVDHRGLRQLALRLDLLLGGHTFSGQRSWQQWLAFLAQQRNQVRQLPSVSRLFSAGVRQGEESLMERACAVLEVSVAQLMRSTFEFRHTRRQFLPTISDAQAQSLCPIDIGLQDARSVLCLSCLGLALGNWLNLPEVVVGQWWPVRNDSRAQHWQDVVGSFEFVFKNKIMLMGDCPVETAQRLFQYAPSALQDAISDALAREAFDAFDAFSLFSFERVDEQLAVPRFEHGQVVQHALGTGVAGGNLRRSLIRIEAAFGSGQVNLRWVYDRKLVPVSSIESLVTRFAFYWKALLKILADRPQPPPSNLNPELSGRVAQTLLTQVPAVERASVVLADYWRNLPYFQSPLSPAPCMDFAAITQMASQNKGTSTAVWMQLDAQAHVLGFKKLFESMVLSDQQQPIKLSVKPSVLFASLMWGLFLGQYGPLSATVFGMSFADRPAQGTDGQGPETLAIYPHHWSIPDPHASFRNALLSGITALESWWEAVEGTPGQEMALLWSPSKKRIEQGSGLMFSRSSISKGMDRDSVPFPFGLTLCCMGEHFEEWALCFSEQCFDSAFRVVDARRLVTRIRDGFVETVQRVLAAPDLPLQKVLPLLGSWSDPAHAQSNPDQASPPVTRAPVDEEETL